MTKLQIYLTGMLVLAALVAAQPAEAQEAGEFAPVVIDPAAALPLPKVVHIPLGRARVFSLPRDVRDVIVTNPEATRVLVKTPRLVYIVGLEFSWSQVVFLDANQKQIASAEIVVGLDTDTLRATFAELMPRDRIEVHSIGANIILSGKARSARSVADAGRIAAQYSGSQANVVNMIEVIDEQQVMLRVRISEVQRRVVKELGVNLFAVLDGGDVALFSGLGINPEAFGVGIAGDGVTSIVTRGFDIIQVAIDALETQGLVKTLAEPNLTAVSGENANFVVGGEFPIPVAQNEDTITVEFRQFGVVLSFTPVVLDSGLISLKVATEVSQLSAEGAAVGAGINIPGLSVNRTQTTIELPSGGTMMIAGLLQDDIRNVVDGVPGLKDVPVLGALFRSLAFQKDETELVITVTPYLVRSVDPNRIALPTDGFAPASDFDMYLLGRLHDVYAKPASAQPAGALQGPIGFIME